MVEIETTETARKTAIIVLITSNRLQELEWILDRTTSDLMGKCLLCWVTVLLWVRVALSPGSGMAR